MRGATQPAASSLLARKSRRGVALPRMPTGSTARISLRRCRCACRSRRLNVGETGFRDRGRRGVRRLRRRRRASRRFATIGAWPIDRGAVASFFERVDRRMALVGLRHAESSPHDLSHRAADCRGDVALRAVRRTCAACAASIGYACMRCRCGRGGDTGERVVPLRWESDSSRSSIRGSTTRLSRGISSWSWPTRGSSVSLPRCCAGEMRRRFGSRSGPRSSRRSCSSSFSRCLRSSFLHARRASGCLRSSAPSSCCRRLVGIVAERGMLLRIPYGVTWQANQSVPPLPLLALGGYFPGYSDRLGIGRRQLRSGRPGTRGSAGFLVRAPVAPPCWSAPSRSPSSTCIVLGVHGPLAVP